MNDDAASILKAGKGMPVLLLHRLLIAADGSPIAYTRMMGSGKKYKIQTELRQIT
jgi:DNA-binding GntR family transcriptional regulator